MNGLVTPMLTARNLAVGGAIVTQRVDDAYGCVKLRKQGFVTVFIVSIEGRMSPTESWYQITTISDTDLDANNSAATLVPLWPEMRANITTYLGGGGTLALTLME